GGGGGRRPPGGQGRGHQGRLANVGPAPGGLGLSPPAPPARAGRRGVPLTVAANQPDQRQGNAPDMDSRIVVADRIANAHAVVALESSVLAQGLPSPANLESADAHQAAVAKADAEPAIIGVIPGRVIVGADAHEVQTLASGAVRWKVTVRDLPYVVARGLGGATAVSATAFAAEAAGIGVMATGGIGGIHFGGGDVSADLPQLARSRITVVCSGPKHVADAAATPGWMEAPGGPMG